jgi:ubiquinone/menaquinone biosynthesis C-methylase UbiE
MSDRIEAFVASMKIRPTDRVLEIGCGHGVAATLICEKLESGSYLAIDRSKKMVEMATKRNQRFVDAGLAAFIQSELESLDLGEKKFDKVLAMRVRLFHEQPEQATRLARRWLAQRGMLFVQYDEPAGR